MSIAGTIFASVLTGIVAALITLAGTTLVARWRIAEANITKERAKWRDKVRALIETAVTSNDNAELERTWVALALRMNPEVSDTRDDRELVALVKSLPGSESNLRRVRRERIVALAAHILKHDWQRAKWEADPFWYWADVLVIDHEIDLLVFGALSDSVSGKCRYVRFLHEKSNAHGQMGWTSSNRRNEVRLFVQRFFKCHDCPLLEYDRANLA